VRALSRGLPGSTPSSAPTGQRQLWDRLVSPSGALVDVGDRRRARLLAGLLVIFGAAGLVVGVVQLALIPGFLTTFAIMLGALAVLGIGYGMARTRHYRAGGLIASLAVMAACLAVGATNPQDRVWYAFLSVSVLVSAIFTSLPLTALVAGLGLGGIAAVDLVVAPLRDPSRLLPPLAFHSIMSVLLLLAARHRRRLEEERSWALLEAQDAAATAARLDGLARLAGAVAHDFNNLLAVISGSVSALRVNGADGEALDDLERAASLSSSLARQLLDFSRPLARASFPLDPFEVVGRLEGILRRLVGKGIDISLERSGATGHVRADAIEVEQVVLNLVVNARDAMPHGGTVRLVIRDVVVGKDGIQAAGVAPGPYVALVVSDTGMGMTEEVRRRIFEPFFTTKPPGGGNGIGLATVSKIIRAQGGHVAVSSTPGNGSTFTVLLPRVAADAPEDGPQPVGA
jgi:signal transduction histidine kinase